MTGTIHTLFHKLTPGRFNDVYFALHNAPKFVFGGDVVKFLAENNAWHSMKALVEAGLAKLPYPEMAVEYAANDNLRWFIHLTEQDGGERFKVKSLFYAIKENKVFCEAEDGLVVTEETCFNAYDFTQTAGAHAAIVAVTMAIFLTNLQGVERQKITPKPSFNKARVAKGKRPVPEYSYVRIGTVYDYEGKPVKGIGGGSVRMHMRRSYNRRQHYGPGNSLIRIVNIPACIVNYNPDEKLEPKLTKVKV